MRFSRYMAIIQKNELVGASHYFRCSLNYQLEMERFELLTPCLQGRCSPN